MKIHNESSGVGMKIGMKYSELYNEKSQWKQKRWVWKSEWNIESCTMKIHNESGGDNYENQNEIAQGIIWKIIMKSSEKKMKSVWNRNERHKQFKWKPFIHYAGVIDN